MTVLKKLNKIPPVPKGVEITWLVCRLILFVWGTVGMMYGYTYQFVQGLFAIAFTHLWDMFQLFGGKSFITRVSYRLPTMLNIFITFGVAVGSTVNLHTSFTGIDIPEHIFAGYLAGSFGFELCVLMQGTKRPIKPSVQAMFALCFSVTLLVGWEFYEFTMDRLYGFDMQHGTELYSGGLTDTMVDLILGSAGSLASMFIESFYKNGIIGKNRKEIRAKIKAEREAFKKEKKAAYENGNFEDFKY